MKNIESSADTLGNPNFDEGWEAEQRRLAESGMLEERAAESAERGQANTSCDPHERIGYAKVTREIYERTRPYEKAGEILLAFLDYYFTGNQAIPDGVDPLAMEYLFVDADKRITGAMNGSKRGTGSKQQPR